MGFFAEVRTLEVALSCGVYVGIQGTVLSCSTKHAFKTVT